MPRLLRRSRVVLAILVGLAACASLGPPATGAATPPQQRAAARALGLEAYRYGLPLLEFLRVRREMTSVTAPDRRADAPVNRLGHARALAGPAVHVIVAPNNDTLYSIAHLDLGREPMVLRVPPFGERYVSFQLMDPYTNAFRYLRRPGTYAITGPGWHGKLPAGVVRVRSAYRRVWMLGRTLVDGPGDLPAVRRLQDRYRLVPLRHLGDPGWRPPRPARVDRTPERRHLPTGLAFFDALGRALAANPPPSRDAPILRRLRAIGVGPGLSPRRAGLTAAQLAGLRDAVRDAPAEIDREWLDGILAGVRTNAGWYLPPANLGAYGTDYRTRALIARHGLGANRPAEAMYPTAIADASGAPLDGRSAYVLRFEPGELPPVRFFWSMTMYDADMFLVANPIDRYAIGDRTPGLRHAPDGALEIVVSHDEPASGTSNWLPAPAGPFRLMLRMYGPKRAALTGAWRPPPVTSSSPAPAP
ncbi:MAG TPA: DUF1254 domain-containing protein [Capillimicrobium sp.]|nr:DUF1254 domain-containing protein [Capillimicrobium sp.]